MRLWGDSISVRLESARKLNRDRTALEAMQQHLCVGCPVEAWPYGNATSINPMLVTLGPSPGGSPNPLEQDSAGDCLALPTAGKPHPHTAYRDTSFYWDKIRLLARTVIQDGTGKTTDSDSYSLFGNMNLDTNESGKASDVRIDEAFGKWVLRTIRDKLRPKFVVCLGLKGKSEAHKLLSDVFEEFDIRHPDQEFPLTIDQRYSFSEWLCKGESGNQIRLVFWPQSPSRPPFTNFENWRIACQEFTERHQGVIQA